LELGLTIKISKGTEARLEATDIVGFVDLCSKLFAKEIIFWSDDGEETLKIDSSILSTLPYVSQATKYH